MHNARVLHQVTKLSENLKRQGTLDRRQKRDSLPSECKFIYCHALLFRLGCVYHVLLFKVGDDCCWVIPVVYVFLGDVSICPCM